MQEVLSDEILAARAKDGYANAFEELFHRYEKKILNFIYRLIGNKETAEEVAQDVFMKAYKNLYLFDPKRRFSTWLYTIARNQVKNAIRDRKYFRDISLEETISGEGKAILLKDVISDPDARPDLAVEADELEKEAQRVLDSLPLEYREVITLCSIQGLSYEEASRIIGCSIASISIRLKKAKELFMKKLGIDLKEKR